MKNEQVKRQTKPPLSLYPLSFDEALTDILKVKPEPKANGKTKVRQRTAIKKK